MHLFIFFKKDVKEFKSLKDLELSKHPRQNATCLQRRNLPIDDALEQGLILHGKIVDVIVDVMVDG